MLATYSMFLVRLWTIALGFSAALSAHIDENAVAKPPAVPGSDDVPVPSAPDDVNSAYIGENFVDSITKDLASSHPNIVITPKDGKLRAEITITAPDISLKPEGHTRYTEVLVQFLANLMKIPLTVWTAVTNAVSSLASAQASFQVSVNKPEEQ